MKYRENGNGSLNQMCVVISFYLPLAPYPMQFNPVDLALSLLDDQPSGGKDLASFSQTKRMLERALKGTIEREHCLDLIVHSL